MSSHAYRAKQSSPEQRLHSRNAAHREAYMNHLSNLRGEEYLKPPTQHGYPTYPGNIYGTPPDKATASTLNMGQPGAAPLVMGNENRIEIVYNFSAPAHYLPDRFAGSGMVQGNMAYPPDRTIVRIGSVGDMPPPPPPFLPDRFAGSGGMVQGNVAYSPDMTIVSRGSVSVMPPPLPPRMPPLPPPRQAGRQAGGSTTANSLTTQYGETAFSYVMAPKQQNLEFHSTDDEGPCDTDRKRHAYQRYLDQTGNSRKLMPAGAKKQPCNKSTAVSPGHHGGVMGTARRSRLRESESENEDSD